jgi:hypothetical protein
MISHHEQLFIAAAVGWVIAACCFILIPSWRTHDIRHMSSSELLNLCLQVTDEIKRRNPGHEKEFNDMADFAAKLVPPQKPWVPPTYDDYE